MMNQWLALVSLVCLVLVCACGCLSWIDWGGVYEEIDGKPVFDSMPVADESYAFDPQVVSTGVPVEDFLTPVPRGWKPTSDTQAGAVRLNDNTLYTIASGMVQSTGKETDLTAIGFVGPCEPAEIAPRSVIFSYVHLDDEVDSYPYLKQTVLIDIAYATVWYQSYRETADSRPTRQTIIEDYPNLPMRMYEALQIAEDNGGREIRSNASGYCEIRGGLGGLRSEGEWEVGYVIFDEDKSHSEWVLRIGIDATTGEARIISE